MKNIKFLTEQSTNIVFATKLYGHYNVKLGNSKTSTTEPYFFSDMNEKDYTPSSDRDLFKAWHHATIARKHGVYATKELLREELINRSYILNEKNRWNKPIEITE